MQLSIGLGLVYCLICLLFPISSLCALTLSASFPDFLDFLRPAICVFEAVARVAMWHFLLELYRLLADASVSVRESADPAAEEGNAEPCQVQELPGPLLP